MARGTIVPWNTLLVLILLWSVVTSVVNFHLSLLFDVSSLLGAGVPLHQSSTNPSFLNHATSRPAPHLKQNQHFINRRKLIQYESSAWEKLWLTNIKKWASSRKICERLVDDQDILIRRFLNATCTAWAPPPFDHWCIMDDAHRPVWYNSANFSHYQLQFERPTTISEEVPMPPNRPVRPTNEEVFSKFTFLDELTNETYIEFIEPLVAALRFPLNKCVRYLPYDFVMLRSYIVPPPHLTRHERYYYFDAGASSWGSGWGGPSLRYFVDIWGRHGIRWDEIYAWEIRTTVPDFYNTVPLEYQNRTFYNQSAIASSPETETAVNPFLPHYIRQKVQDPNDYTLFKLDIDSPYVEEGTILYILNQTEERVVDELLWEHHCNSYLLKLEWGKDPKRKSIWESYNLFLQLRHKGIRAHSWI
jgi:hypothetical protein